MAPNDFVVSADGHIVEPTDLFRTRLPKHLRDRGFWEEDFDIEPLVEGGVREFARVRTPGFEGWAVSRYRHFDGTPHTGDPERMLDDMDLDGIDAQVMHPNRSLFALYSDDHELSIAHARVYNDYVVERYTPYLDRIAPTAPIPLTDIDDAVAEIERVAGSGFRAILLPANAPLPLYAADLDPVWAAARANGTHVFFHCATGGVKMGEAESPVLRQVRSMADELNHPMDSRIASKRMMAQCVYNTINPQQIVVELLAGGVPERYPELHFGLIEFNAHWLASLVGAIEKAWTTGVGQDADWWLGYWDDSRGAGDQPQMARMFDVNEKWPHPLRPAEYVQRQFHVSFQDDPIAVACRHVTGVSTIVWGSDYPHAEGTFRGSQALIAQQFAGVSDEDRAAMLGGTLGDLLGLEH
ncbi:MAG TPA: amidohydrolase family protein [Acidimicrobiia bacterium]|jgi:predicted TIM-barrel fold metal-dependent hydrolase|nr:amidohydrolase family protein [Acidimicrobiia bacterium]